MDECSAGLCARGQFARGDVLEAFDDGLQTVRAPVGSVWGQRTDCFSRAVVSNDQRQRRDESARPSAPGPGEGGEGDVYSRYCGSSWPNERMPEMPSLLIVAIVAQGSHTAQSHLLSSRVGDPLVQKMAQGIGQKFPSQKVIRADS